MSIQSAASSSSTERPQVEAKTRNQSVAAAAARPPTVFERFMNVVSFRRRDSDVEFPPAHWLDGIPGPLESENNELPERSTATSVDPSIVPAEDGDNTQVPEPVSFANKIRAMLATAPSIFSSNPASTASTLPSVGAPNVIRDQQMLSFISSPSVMNGSAANKRLSVWACLNRLQGRIPQGPHDMSDLTSETDRDTGPPEGDDNSSIMLCGPLLPEEGATVELAKTEVVHDADEEPGDLHEAMTGEVSGNESFAQNDNAPPSARPKTARVHVRKTKDRRVWVPSSTQISLEIMWWGYRLYFPPPVLDMLDSKQLEGAKRAALVTTALKWLLDHVPILLIPPNMRPALKILKGLVPYLGYIGGFVAWSWSYIKKFDKGNGVTLTATWLATLALVPGTWEEADTAAKGRSKLGNELTDQAPSAARGHDAECASAGDRSETDP